MLDVIVHYESERAIPLPRMAVYAWDQTERHLDAYLLDSESPAENGDRFLVGRYTLPDRVYIEYILTRSRNQWQRHIAVWKDETPYDYDYDVFTVRPMEILFM